MCKENYNYYQKALLYCVDGNLQAVLDEYRFTINGKLGDKLVVAESNAVLIETRDSLLNKEGRKMYVRTHFATQYVDKVVTDNSTKQTSKMQDISNSPFRPFVLATTSVGQEGLNFHWYARKLIHWNIPSNPVDMELLSHWQKILTPRVSSVLSTIAVGLVMLIPIMTKPIVISVENPMSSLKIDVQPNLSACIAGLK